MEERRDLGGGAEAVAADPCVAAKKVVELLTAQIEEADLNVVNKVCAWLICLSLPACLFCLSIFFMFLGGWDKYLCAQNRT